MATPNKLISFPNKGQHTEVEKVAVPVDAYHFGVNVRTEKLCLKQRFGTRELTIRSEDGTDVDEFQQLLFQHSITFSPATGSSAIQFSDKGSSIIVSASGRKFNLRVVGGKWNAIAYLSEISTVSQLPDMYEVYMAEAENFLISGDDRSDTWVYQDGVSDRFSNGYNVSDREFSEVPNRMRLPTYAHGRLVCVVGDRSLLVGDIIHGGNTTTPEDVIKFTEQTYWAEGQRFVVPSEAGKILSLYSLPVLGDNTRHGDLIIECEFQTWALDLDVYPRTTWSDTPMLRLVSLEGGAQGQNAYDTFNNDAIRRTQSGVETLSFSNQIGDSIRSPQRNIGYPIWQFIKKDDGEYLRHTSLKMHRREQRFYCTVRPSGSSQDWGSRGWLSYNYESKAWDGLWTPPYWASNIKMFIKHPMAGEERFFMFAGGDGKKIRLLEIDDQYEHDWDESGNAQNIESIVDTRSLFADLNSRIAPQDAVIQFSDVKGDFKWEVDWKGSSNPSEWNVWNCNVAKCSHQNPRVITETLSEFEGYEINGAEVKSDIEYHTRIVWEGSACLRFFEVRVDVLDDHHNEETSLENICNLSHSNLCEDYFRYSNNNETV